MPGTPVNWLPVDQAVKGGLWTPAYAAPDQNAADIAALDGFTRLAGAIGLPADAGHKHQLQLNRVVAQSSGTQSIPNATSTLVAFNNTPFQLGSGVAWAAGTPTRLTFSIACVALIWAYVQWDVTATGSVRQINLLQNGVGPPLGSDFTEVPTTASIIQAPTGFASIMFPAVNDYFEINAFQNSGGALNINTQNPAMIGALILGV